jgi:hypothetical protein
MMVCDGSSNMRWWVFRKARCLVRMLGGVCVRVVPGGCRRVLPACGWCGAGRFGCCGLEVWLTAAGRSAPGPLLRRWVTVAERALGAVVTCGTLEGLESSALP